MLELQFSYRRDNFSLAVNQTLDAPITGIMGASGSGKSTLLALFAGLLTPRDGVITLNNNVLCDTRTKQFIPPHQRHIGLVFQDGQLLPHLSVRHNLLYGYNNIAPAQRRFSLDTIVELLEIAPLLARRPVELSGGEKQRVALGRAVLYSPQLLLLDEPLSALDERLKQQILPFFLRIYRECNIPMIYVTHALSEIHQLTDECLWVENGELIRRV
ncbi:ATP-binding cassette domain-containing protein [Cellvibrio sp. PSBB023]|uniref:ATP-binding cassette domain-containing protein n=1 Tax=Cellvibrio sp. PSBB023 TaxID=1945512 RepID=UPI00098EC35F|nr:ATP-binding cassette domain-containing protein [Cellvibrio sp. PSBB023]AQT60818.1 molybdenum ABC transporter ATP-binding protein [Cellvibrio sp. PSBB023]